MAVCRYRTHNVEQRRVAAVYDAGRVGQPLGQVEHRSIFGSDVVAKKKKACVEVALCGHERLHALVAGGHRNVKAHEVVLTVERSLQNTTRRLLDTCPSAHQFGVLQSRTETHNHGTAHKRAYLIAVEAAVAQMERRNDTSVDKQFVVDKRSEIFQHGRHCSHAVRNSVAFEHLHQAHVARTFHNHTVVSLAHMFAHSSVCNCIHRRNGEQQIVALVGTDVVFQISIALLRLQPRGVYRSSIAEHTLHNLKRVSAVGGVDIVATSHCQHYYEQYI